MATVLTNALIYTSEDSQPWAETIVYEGEYIKRKSSKSSVA